MNEEGEIPRLAGEPVWCTIVGSEFSSIVLSPLGLKWDLIGTAPAKGFESKQSADWKSSSKYASRVTMRLWGWSGE